MNSDDAEPLLVKTHRILVRHQKHVALVAERDALLVQVAALKAALSAALVQCARSNEPEALRAADLLRAALAEVPS